jgi:hypothetical protein
MGASIALGYDQPASTNLCETLENKFQGMHLSPHQSHIFRAKQRENDKLPAESRKQSMRT